MRFDLARHPAFPYRQLCRTLLWISILAAAVAIVSCTTLEATGQIVAPTITWIPTASPLTSRTANPTFTDSIPAPEASPIAHAERMATDISFPQADQIPSTTVPLATSAPTETPTAEAAPVYTFRVLDAFPHDPEAFTQGLVLEDDVFYEGTGLWGQSTLRRVDPETGDVLQLYTLPPEYFGEGITIWKDSIIQLTWKARLGFVYNRDSFELRGTFPYPNEFLDINYYKDSYEQSDISHYRTEGWGLTHVKNSYELQGTCHYPTEGWGLTHDGTKLIMSDGTSTLHFLDPETFAEIGQVQVYDALKPVTMLNELEYVKGEVYANVWRTDLIAIIDPETGRVTGWIDLEDLLNPEDYPQPVDVLNGIAYDANADRLFVTGKLWPKIFEIELFSTD